MFCGEIISNFVDSSEYDDKSRLYIMNGGQRSNHSTVSWVDLLLVRHYSILYYSRLSSLNPYVIINLTQQPIYSIPLYSTYDNTYYYTNTTQSLNCELSRLASGPSLSYFTIYNYSMSDLVVWAHM